MRHPPGNQRARTLFRSLLHHWHAFRDLRRGDDFPFSLGRSVSHVARPSSRCVRPVLHVRISRHPPRRIRLALQEGRAGPRLIRSVPLGFSFETVLAFYSCPCALTPL